MATMLLALKRRACAAFAGAILAACATAAPEEAAAPPPPHHRDGRFQNNYFEFAPRGLSDLLSWQWAAARAGLPKPPQTPTPVVKPELDFIGAKPDITEENIQSRARGMTLMAISNKFGKMVLSTGNKSEMSTGYATLYGDMCGGYAVLKDVYKTTVFALC